MDITDIIEPEIICLELQADSKQAVFEELVELLDRAGKLSNKVKIHLMTFGSVKP